MRFRPRFILLGTVLTVACGAPTTGRLTVQDLSVGPVHYLDDTVVLNRIAGPPLRRRTATDGADTPFGTWYYQGFECRMIYGWRCDQLTTTDSGTSVAGRVHVGMTSEQVASVLGPPADRARRADTLYLLYQLDSKSSKGQGLVAKFTADTARVYLVGRYQLVLIM